MQALMSGSINHYGSLDGQRIESHVAARQNARHANLPIICEGSKVTVQNRYVRS